jgi:sec-independent protein translocase protein TatA
MAFDDPIVWILIIAVVVFLFGANKIPGLAKAFGQAKKEFNDASKSITDPNSPPATAQTYVVPQQQQYYQQQPPPMPSQQGGAVGSSPSQVAEDPLIVAAQKEGIDTAGKTRDQIASELAWKLKSK